MTKPEFNDDHELDRGRDHELTILSKEDKTEIFHTRDYIRLIRYLIRDMHRNEDLNTTIGNIDKVNFYRYIRPKILPPILPKKLPSFECQFYPKIVSKKSAQSISFPKLLKIHPQNFP